VIVIDTSVLSMVFRRVPKEQPVHPVVSAFRRRIENDDEMLLPGVVYQEVLSGVRTEPAFAKLEEALSGFPILLADEATHRKAAQVRNACTAAGVTSASFDCLIAAHTLLLRGGELFTLDLDFKHISNVVGLKLHRF
jgi:predicted nucleic acid-binding protein